ncbi:MAG: DUF4071 domain-containing protein [Acidobacteria bacterium]|nr:DUF4071 domain-containing protein [Acidobacteriota bacterium]
MSQPQSPAGAAPLCFVLMPFGRKPAPDGTLIDFDRVYADVIAPAIEAAGLEPFRADHENAGGIIHKPMFERLILCPFAVADLTLANANVFYELGVRHAFRPYSTVQMIAEGSRLPFDVQMLRTIPYGLGKDGLPDPAKLEGVRKAVARCLDQARDGAKDSPIYQLLDGLKPADIAHLKTDVFRDQVAYSNQVRNDLTAARKAGADAVRAVDTKLGDVADCDAGVVVDLYLSYRATKAWGDMVALYQRMPPPLQQTVMVREQLAFALNRLGQTEEAEKVLLALIAERGPSSETNGLLGRVYKDRWEAAVKAGESFSAKSYLKQAVDAYLKGFETDWRDAYPGVNAVTLMELSNPPDIRRLKLIHVVRYAVERKIENGRPDYWDYATLIELAVIESNEVEAEMWLGDALNAIREKWEPETTVRNLRLIRERREAAGTQPAWANAIEKELAKRAS